jgi:hypothetical protein
LGSAKPRYLDILSFRIPLLARRREGEVCDPSFRIGKFGCDLFEADDVIVGLLEGYGGVLSRSNVKEMPDNSLNRFIRLCVIFNYARPVSVRNLCVAL